MTWTLLLPLPPSGNVYWRHVGDRVVRSAEAKRYCGEVARRCAVVSIKPVRGYYRITIMARGLRANADLGNLEKILSDALEGWAYLDDKRAWRIELERDIGPCEEAPHVEVTITPRIEDDYATPDEVSKARMAKMQATAKRKATLRRNRALKGARATWGRLKPSGPT